MTDDQKTLADELDRLSGFVANLAGRVRRLNKAGDVVDGFLFLSVAEAAQVCGVSGQAIRTWIDHAARMGRPIAQKCANTWIVDVSRLLAYVEKHRGGLPARVKGENLLKKYWPIWSGPQKLCPDVPATG
jgi:hypothetical protein